MTGQVTTADTTESVLDHLQEQGYEPSSEAVRGSDWYDLIVSGIGTVRVCMHPRAGYLADVYVFDGYMTGEWQVSLSQGTPAAAIIAVLQSAEWQLAAKRGGPVTPAQAARAR